MLRDHPPSKPWRHEAPSRLQYYPALRMVGRPMTHPPRHCTPFLHRKHPPLIWQKTAGWNHCFDIKPNSGKNKYLLTVFKENHAPSNLWHLLVTKPVQKRRVNHNHPQRRSITSYLHSERQVKKISVITDSLIMEAPETDTLHWYYFEEEQLLSRTWGRLEDGY